MKITKKIKKEVLGELQSMFEIDQKIRQPDSKYNKKIDIENTKKLKKLINKFGWLNKERFGGKSEIYSWVIVQHADYGVKFQEKCLKLMKEFPKEKRREQHIAYLSDRILVNKKRKQLYGTQFYTDKKGKFKPRPIRDFKNIEKRRKQMNLKSFKKYINEINKFKKCQK
jgi:hypothetical protein|tara:strand:+ start:448 stop:954 length:507 start_codon:yes stop_codon:yes gene_type:complete